MVRAAAKVKAITTTPDNTAKAKRVTEFNQTKERGKAKIMGKAKAKAKLTANNLAIAPSILAATVRSPDMKHANAGSEFTMRKILHPKPHTLTIPNTSRTYKSMRPP